MKEFFNNVVNFLRNVWKWRVILWHDHDWDSGYLFDVMKFKVDDLYNGINKYRNHVDYENDLRWLRITSKLIDRVNTEWYQCEYQDYLVTKIKWVDVVGEPNLQEIEFETVSDNTMEYIKKYKNNYRLMGKETPITITSVRSIPLHLAHYNHNKARKLLFKIIEEKIEGWWD